MSKPAVRRPMTPHEAEAVKCFRQVRFTPCSFDKRFGQRMSDVTDITEKEAPQVWRLFLRYRRQIQHPQKAELLRIAEERSAPDLRKLEAARKDQQRIDKAKADARESAPCQNDCCSASPPSPSSVAPTISRSASPSPTSGQMELPTPSSTA